MQVSNVRNLLAQLNSVLQVGKLWERKHSERKYSAVLFARPDVNFTCPFPADMLENLQVRTHAWLFPGCCMAFHLGRCGAGTCQLAVADSHGLYLVC